MFFLNYFGEKRNIPIYLSEFVFWIWNLIPDCNNSCCHLRIAISWPIVIQYNSILWNETRLNKWYLFAKFTIFCLHYLSYWYFYQKKAILIYWMKRDTYQDILIFFSFNLLRFSWYIITFLLYSLKIYTKLNFY